MTPNRLVDVSSTSVSFVTKVGEEAALVTGSKAAAGAPPSTGATDAGGALPLVKSWGGLTLADRAWLVEAGSSLVRMVTLLVGMGDGNGDAWVAVSTVLTAAGGGDVVAASNTGSELVMPILPAFSHFSLRGRQTRRAELLVYVT